jgi:hypothetical protein
LTLAALLALAAPLSGCAEDAARNADRIALAATRAVPAHALVEVDLRLNASASIAWDWSALPTGSVLLFNVHSHDGPRVVEHARTRTGHARGAFSAPVEGVYSLLWENEGATDLSVRYAIEGDFTT